MMKTWRTLAVAALSFAVFAPVRSADAQTCNPGIGAAFARHSAEYTRLVNAVVPQLASLQAELAAVNSISTYNTLLNHARSIVTTINTPAPPVGGRVVITLPDGTVVVDTSRTDDLDCVPSTPGTCDPSGQRNGYNHYLAKNVNENHNSRIAIHDSQEWPCGFGLETKFSTSTGQNEHYLAIRLPIANGHLENEGTVRVSLRQ
jgi:hypothetical protein